MCLSGYFVFLKVFCHFHPPIFPHLILPTTTTTNETLLAEWLYHVARSVTTKIITTWIPWLVFIILTFILSQFERHCHPKKFLPFPFFTWTQLAFFRSLPCPKRHPFLLISEKSNFETIEIASKTMRNVCATKWQRIFFGGGAIFIRCSLNS